MYSYFADRTPTISLIEKNLLYEQGLKNEIKMQETYLNALQEQTLGYIRHLECAGYFTQQALWKSWRYFSDKSDKEKLKDNFDDYKGSYKYIENIFKSLFIPDCYKHKITKFIMCGMDEYAFSITFDIWENGNKSNKKEFNIQIPVVTNINQKNIEYAYYGKYRLGCKNGLCDKFIVASYKDKDIKDKLLELMQRREGCVDC